MAVNTTWVRPDTTLDLATGGTITEAWVDGVASDLLRLGGTAGLWQVTNAGLALLNGTANANMTIGLTINQGAADDEILALKSSDVAHGITAQAETDTYGNLKKQSATAGGLHISGISEATDSLNLAGWGATDDTTKSAAGTAYITVQAAKKSGTDVAATGANANLLAILNFTTTTFLFDAEGSAHADVEWVAFDDHDDVALLNALDAAMTKDPVKTEFGRYLSDFREQLQAAGIVNFYDPNGPRAMVNFTRLAMLLVGAVRQMGQRNAELMGRLATIEQRLALLPRGG